MIRRLPAADRPAKPWKNGGGILWDVAVSPEAAGLDDFHWRLSMAEVAMDGPFSSFPGIDRTIAILAGEGLVLEIEGRAPVTLTPASAPYDFPGDRPTFGRLVAGKVLDLNLMVRRAGTFDERGQSGVSKAAREIGAAPPKARMSRRTITDDLVLESAAGLLVWQAGEARIDVDGLAFSPGPFDAWQSDGPARWEIRPRGEARFWLVELG